jgi:hypothetical protein
MKQIVMHRGKEELMMIRLFAMSGTALANAFAASLFVTAVAAVATPIHRPAA